MSNTSLNTVAWSSTEERAIKLLGGGLGPEAVATAVGVTPSRISQLLAMQEFATAVADLRFQNLQKHNEIDASYDDMEQKLLGQLKDVLPMMMRPMEILKAVQVLNAAKRRGQSAPESITHQNTVVNLHIPTQIIQKFSINSNNQVTNVGSQTLETIQSGTLLSQAKAKALEVSTGTGVSNELSIGHSGSRSS